MTGFCKCATDICKIHILHSSLPVIILNSTICVLIFIDQICRILQENLWVLKYNGISSPPKYSSFVICYNRIIKYIYQNSSSSVNNVSYHHHIWPHPEPEGVGRVGECGSHSGGPSGAWRYTSGEAGACCPLGASHAHSGLLRCPAEEMITHLLFNIFLTFIQ